MPDNKPLEELSLQELEAMLENPDTIGKEEAPAPVEATPPVEAATPPVEVETKPEETTPAETPAPEIDQAAIEAETRRIDDERRDTEMQKLMAHNSRLAGQIGELRKAQSRAGTEYQEIPQDDERIVELRAAVQEMREAQRSEARNRAVAEEVNSVLAKPYLKDVDQSLIAAATQKFEAAWEEALSEDDPDLARLNCRTVLLSTAAEARRLQLAQAQNTARERSAEQTRVATSAKLKASVSGGGSAAVPTPQVQLRDKSLDELAKMLDEATR